MAFIFIRHLPTAYNQQGLLQGRRDEAILPLETKWHEKIANTRQQLAEYAPFQHILCSPLRRTQETAACYGLEANIEPLLLELDFGIYEGQPRQRMLDEVGEQWLNDPAHLSLGEPLQAVLSRVRHYFQHYAHKESDGHVLAFGHGAWIRAARAWAHNGVLDSMNQAMLPNNALLILDPK